MVEAMSHYVTVTRITSWRSSVNNTLAGSLTAQYPLWIPDPRTLLLTRALSESPAHPFRPALGRPRTSPRILAHSRLLPHP